LRIIAEGSGDTPLPNPVLELYDPEGFLIAANDDFPGRGRNAVLDIGALPVNSFWSGLPLPSPSTYRIVVSAIDTAGLSHQLSNKMVYVRKVLGGDYDLKVFTGAFAGPGPTAPVLASVTPNIAVQGAADLLLTLRGSGFADSAAVLFSGDGITVTNVEYISPGELRVTMNIAENASPGFRNVILINADGGEDMAEQLFEIRESLGSVRLSWDAPEAGVAMAAPQNLAAQLVGPGGPGALSSSGGRGRSDVGRVVRQSPGSKAAVLECAFGEALIDVNEVEPNNTPEEAQVLEGDSVIVVHGNAEASDEGELILEVTEDDIITLEDDVEDLYRITLTAPGLSVALAGFSSDCDLYLFDDSDTTGLWDYSATIGATEVEGISDAELPAGNYLIGVSLFDPIMGGSDSTPYVLTVAGRMSSESPSGPASYQVYRSSSPGARANGRMVGSVESSVRSYSDPPLSSGTFYYQVTAVYDGNESEPSNEVSAAVTSVKGDRETSSPADFTLGQNYPNPFNPLTTISYALPKNCFVEITIIDILGRQIRSLLSENRSHGNHSVTWNGLDDAGNQVASGVYLYMLKTGGYTETKKLLLIR